MTASPPTRAVLFDAVGTLIAPAEPVGESYARIAREQGVSISAWRLEDAFGRVWRASPPMVFPGAADVAAAERDAWRAIVRQTFLAADSAVRLPDPDGAFEALFAHYGRGAAWRPRDGAVEAVGALHAAGVATAVVSNFDRRLPRVLADLGLAPALDLVWLPSDAGAAKPDPAIFTGALGALGVAPARALFVGDDADRDLAGARAAGLRALDVGALATLAQLPALLASELPEEPSP